MGKSLRSKVKRRWRNLKRNYLDQILVKPKLTEISQKLQATIVGIEYRKQQCKNAFLDPNDPNAQFPQYKPQPIIDLRSTSIPGSGREYVGASRKFMNDKQKDIQQKSIDAQNNMEAQTIKINRSLLKKKKKPGKNKKTLVF